MLSSHKVPAHNCERICDIEERQIDDIRSIVSETRSKITSCDALSADLENMLSDLQQQRDYAQDLIKETCYSYKAVIEKCQVCTESAVCVCIFVWYNIVLPVLTLCGDRWELK